MATTDLQPGRLRVWFFSVGVPVLVGSLIAIIRADPSPWLAIWVPLQLLGIAMGGGLLYVGVRFPELVRTKALLPQFLLKGTLGVAMLTTAIILIRKGFDTRKLEGPVVEVLALSYLLWWFTRYRTELDEEIPGTP